MTAVLDDAEVYRKLTMLGEHPEYAEAMDYRLKVQLMKLGEFTGETETLTVGLADANVEVLEAADDSGSHGDDFARVVAVEYTGGMLRLEADHRGPEHGWDGWVGKEGPKEVVNDIELLGVDRDE